ncbi:dihydrodipicolinate synthase [Enterobacter asburiae]|uniref:Dihydrodipicolinate synthase n=1 Tax=Enterobacter asburiae TaxID=61645 RepID=A0A376FHA4_ENTAS|nr:dihydrodipicolinate synthase [Enterobacter asburiae]
MSLRYVILVGGEISLLILARWPTAVSRLILSKKDNTMFHGLSAFPLTPLKEGTFDEHAFINLLRPPWSTLAWIHWAHFGLNGKLCLSDR